MFIRVFASKPFRLFQILFLDIFSSLLFLSPGIIMGAGAAATEPQTGSANAEAFRRSDSHRHDRASAREKGERPGVMRDAQHLLT